MKENNVAKKYTKPILIVLGVLFIMILSIKINNDNAKKEYEMIVGAPTIVDLGSDCYTCTQQKGYLDVLKERYVNVINIKKIDIYENHSEAEKYNVKVIPTLVFLDKDGEEVYKHEGLLTDIELEQKLIDLDLLSDTCKSPTDSGC